MPTALEVFYMEALTTTAAAAVTTRSPAKRLNMASSPRVATVGAVGVEVALQVKAETQVPPLLPYLNTLRLRSLRAVVCQEIGYDFRLVLLVHRRTEDLHHFRHLGLPAFLVQKNRVHL